ncbi:ammonium transporter [Gilvimarinus agarilyticus]|uniref:ammonium transporter n=1 Tax=Gilvimarinus sp. 2_MG-2023 TaxID=3062666 RepID=UPI001C088C33|nr:ammonium transporter [Gilvimarinus sp. 2_MG-2023]MBU2885097.1 ammonium transporter [Gilvimarinus agarilyticus]MDO6569994.1 ammonium transporter [Gilvimarinus sp. 2_MG-2023]
MVGLLALALPASADTLNGANTAWILTATALVLFMTLPGLSLFYGGLVRAKNILSVLMQCFAIACIASLLWLIVGYTLSFGEGNAFIGDFSHVLFAGLGKESLSGDIPEPLFGLFQMTFAVITPALIVGAFAERMKFSSMLIFSSFWLLAVYVPVCHWVWGGGFLSQWGLLDFAGGTVVHITAGVAALVAALVIGRRDGFATTAMPPHNMTMTVTGAGMLWVGWFGFNGGSALAANGDAAMAMLVTHISAAAGSLAWMTVEWIKFRKPSVLGIVTGMVAGLGTITPASGYVGPGGALVIGLLAGVICFFMTQTVKRVWKIDDSLDVFPVHGVGGILGTLLAGVFASPHLGVFSGYGFSDAVDGMSGQVWVQFLGVIITFVYTAIVTWVLLKITGVMTSGLRVTREEELIGLDITMHEEEGYKL